MDHSGSRYEGTMVHGRLEGEGKYFFPNGNVYVGEFLDGAFHGEGTLYFPNRGKFCATWDRGTAVDGVYSFRDGLVFQPTPKHEAISLTTDPWPYCKGTDRRYHTEHLNGLQPAGQSQLVDVEPPREIPDGCYDTGDGYFNPELGLIHSYEGKFLRAPNLEELSWIPAHCRRGGGTDAPPERKTHRGHGGDLPAVDGDDEHRNSGGVPDAPVPKVKPREPLPEPTADAMGGPPAAGGTKKNPRNVKRPRALRAREPDDVLPLLSVCARRGDGPSFLGLFADGDTMLIAAGMLSALQAAAMAARNETRKQLSGELQRICTEYECNQDHIPRHLASGATLSEIAKVRLFTEYSTKNVGKLASEILRALGGNGCPRLSKSGDGLTDVRVVANKATGFLAGTVTKFVLCKYNTWTLVPDLGFIASWNPVYDYQDLSLDASQDSGSNEQQQRR